MKALNICLNPYSNGILTDLYKMRSKFGHEVS